MTPAPRALQLWTRARNVARPPPPLGLRAWTEAAEDIAVLLEGSARELDATGTVAAQIPGAETRPPSSAIIILGASAARAGGWKTLWLRPTSLKIARAPRCTALLARGYVDIGAASDSRSGDLVWGFAPAPIS